ncbi:MAG: penicillin-binding protein 2 [Treponema sp.]|jgi:penicillin-binding protein 2|nr:penicillin-binding protein 2 [Treponema sp.]
MNESQVTRINVFRILLILIFVFYTIKLFNMQILSGDVYRSRAQDISRRTYSIPTQRGEIYDRNFTDPFVINRDAFAVFITPSEVPRGNMDDVINSVSSILNLTPDEIRARLPSQYLQLYQPVEIASNVPFSAIAALAERKNTLPGISWNIKSVRNYVDVGSLSHILGYVGDITRDELTTLYNQGYQQGDVIGKSGIERQYDELLRGKQGWETRTVDSRGRRITGRENVARVPPERGRNLVLTIDANLQTLVEKAIGSQIGAAVVMRPSTGEILAMVSYPWYDPNIFTDGLGSTDYLSLVNDPSKPFINRAIQSSYPPASTFKIIVSTAILSDNLFPTEQNVLCSGVMRYGNRDWHCHILPPGHGRLNLRGALGQSCNIYFMTVGRDYVGAEKIVTYARDYGYGEITGIDLPGEITGFIPTPQWKERRYHERWVLGDTMNMSIGQGYTLVTPLQMTSMVSMIVNNGKIYKPHVLKEVRDPVTNAIEMVVSPELMHESNIDNSVFETVRQNMRGVVSQGTAQYPLNMRTVQIAGKSGTAEIGLADRWHSWFTAYAPFNSTNPDDQIVVTVIIEAANFQVWRATAASAIIFQGYFANQDYEAAMRSLGFQYMVTQESQQ